MDTIIEQCLTSFDYIYVITINILTYIIIKIIDSLNGEKIVSTWNKRLVLIGSILIVTAIYIYTGTDDYQLLFRSAIITPVAWSWIFKPICKKLKIDYKSIDKVLGDKDDNSNNK